MKTEYSNGEKVWQEPDANGNLKVVRIITAEGEEVRYDLDGNRTNLPELDRYKLACGLNEGDELTWTKDNIRYTLRNGGDAVTSLKVDINTGTVLEVYTFYIDGSCYSTKQFAKTIEECNDKDNT